MEKKLEGLKVQKLEISEETTELLHDFIPTEKEAAEMRSDIVNLLFKLSGTEKEDLFILYWLNLLIDRILIDKGLKEND